MNDKLKDLAKKDNMDIPESFNRRFEESLNNLGESRKTKNSKYQVAAGILITFLVSSGVVIAISNNKYKYVPSVGYVFESEEKIYGLDNPIEKEDIDGNKIYLDMQIMEEQNRARVSVGGKYFLPKSDKSELKIGNKIYKNTRTGVDELEYSWGVYDIFEGIKDYKEGQNIVYTIYLDDENKVDFKLSLKEIQGVENYDNLGITSIYNNISITAAINENEEDIVVDLFSDNNIVHITPGTDDGTFSGIYLMDANGKRVSGLRQVENGSIKYSRVKFDTRDTQKPYKIVIPQIVANFFMIESLDIYSSEITLDIPKDGESIEINKDVKLNIKDTNIDTDNDTVKLTSGKREGDKFIVNVEYQEKEKGKDYLRQVFAVEEKIFGKEKDIYAQSYFDEENNLRHTLEFDVNMFKNKIKFKLTPCIYDLKGNWEFIIE